MRSRAALATATESSAIGVIAGFAPILDQNVEGAGERELLELARTDQARLRDRSRKGRGNHAR